MLIKVIAIQNIREKMKRCYFCKGKVVEKKVKVDFRWGEELVVPGEECPGRSWAPDYRGGSK
jgi:PP-loop superfamily ATP-utilizing enzyme